MLTALRHAIIAAHYRPGHLLAPTPAELLQAQAAWAATAA